MGVGARGLPERVVVCFLRHKREEEMGMRRSSSTVNFSISCLAPLGYSFFTGASASQNKRLLSNPAIQRGIQKGLKILGETN